MKKLAAMIVVLMYMGTTVAHSDETTYSSIRDNDPNGANPQHMTLPDRSNSHSSLDWSHGILAMVRLSAPNVPVYSWDAGTVDCSQSVPGEIFYLKNFGTEAIDITSPPILIEHTGFGRTTACPCTGVLEPGQINSCSLTLSFSPSGDGVYRDTMRIQTNAWNGFGGFVRFPLSGTQVSTPAAPHLVVQIQGNDAHLIWNRVANSVFGCPMQVAQYRVYYSVTATGTSYYLTTTADTSYVHPHVAQQFDHFFYKVTARNQ